jgi:hypothetical protein
MASGAWWHNSYHITSPDEQHDIILCSRRLFVLIGPELYEEVAPTQHDEFMVGKGYLKILTFVHPASNKDVTLTHDVGRFYVNGHRIPWHHQEIVSAEFDFLPLLGRARGSRRMTVVGGRMTTIQVQR